MMAGMAELDRSSVPADFLSMSAGHMSRCLTVIAFCAAQLTRDQMSHRGGAHENSFVNLLLHLEGNIRQWVLHGIAGDPDVRHRDDEFALDTAALPGEALQRLAATVDRATAVIAAVPHDRLLEIIDPQPNGTWRHTTVLEAVFKVTSHLDHHTGQIILLTKQLARTDLDLSVPRKR